jgi:hypothetical protein
MPFTADEIANINNSTLENYINKGTVFAQNVQNKPLVKVMNSRAGSFSGGKDNVSFAIKSGQGGGALAGYTHDDPVSFYNPTGTKRARFPWKEHHIGMNFTHTELKVDGIEVMDEGADASTEAISGREEFALANLLDEKMEILGEDFAFSLNRLLWGDGTTDSKALAGIQSLILANPGVGSTGGVSRVANPWWRNRAATAAFGGAGGQGAITSAPTGGGALVNFLEREKLQLTRFANGGTSYVQLAGSDFIDAYKREMRANGFYSQTGWSDTQDASMGDIQWNGKPIQYDPTLDDLGMAKRMYVIDVGSRGVKLLYLNGKRIKKHNPARPYDRYVIYNGMTTTAVMVAKQLNTSAVYDIA